MVVVLSLRLFAIALADVEFARLWHRVDPRHAAHSSLAQRRGRPKTGIL